MRKGRALVWSIMLATVLVAGPASARPSRILSFNLCTDQLVLLLADRRDVQSVTWLARDCEISTMCNEAASLPVNYGTSEELVAAAPDLLIAGRYTTRPAVALAASLGIKVLDLDVPVTLDDIRRQIIDVARAIGREERGQAVVAAFDRRLANIPEPDAAEFRPVAAIYRANGFTVGKGSLIDEVLARAGFDNLATRLAVDGYAYMPLEELIAGKPDLLVLNSMDEIRPSLAGAMLKHPVLRDAFAGDHLAEVPQRLWTCAGPAVLDAIELLYRSRLKLEAHVR